MNAVIYARYSSHNQTEQSIEGQLRDCYEYAKRNDLTIIGEYIDSRENPDYIGFSPFYTAKFQRPIL